MFLIECTTHLLNLNSKILSKNGFYKWQILNKLRNNSFSSRPILSKQLNENLENSVVNIFNDQSLWEYHNITFV